MFHINFNYAIYTIKPVAGLFPFFSLLEIHSYVTCFTWTNLKWGLILEKVFISPKVPYFIDLKTILFHLNGNSSCILDLFCQDDNNNLNTIGTPMHKHTTIFFSDIWVLHFQRVTQGVRRVGRDRQTLRMLIKHHRTLSVRPSSRCCCLSIHHLCDGSTTIPSLLLSPMHCPKHILFSLTPLLSVVSGRSSCGSCS